MAQRLQASSKWQNSASLLKDRESGTDRAREPEAGRREPPHSWRDITAIQRMPFVPATPKGGEVRGMNLVLAKQS